MRRNINGLTYREWIQAAGGRGIVDSCPAYSKAWEAGEDPCDWKVPS